MSKPKKTKTVEEQQPEIAQVEEVKVDKEVTCQICKGKVPKNEAVFRTSGSSKKYYHNKCITEHEKESEYRLKLQQTVADIIGEKKLPKNLCIRLENIKNEYKDEKFTYGGMLLTLEYILNVIQFDIWGADGGLSLIPQFYQEAKEFYYSRRDYENYLDSLMAQSIDPFEIPVRVVKITPPKQERKIHKFIDISEIK